MYNMNLMSAVKAGTRFIKPNINSGIKTGSGPNTDLAENPKSKFNKKDGGSYSDSGKGKDMPGSGQNRNTDPVSGKEFNDKFSENFKEGIDGGGIEVTITKKQKTESVPELLVSPDKLREAVIWSEILGKPLSKRRKRR